MKKLFYLLATLLFPVQYLAAQASDFPQLDKWVETWKTGQQTYFGYPVNQQSAMHDFYEWYLSAGMEVINLNNAGDPMTGEPWKMSSHAFEREVIEYFAPYYGFGEDEVWGIVTHSGTDGNNHGIYFGANYLKNKTKMEPVVYVSDEAHYSNMRLAHLQNLDMRLIKSDPMGRMIPEELEKALDTSRPVLIIYAMGSTFKGAIDDMEALNAVLDRHTELPAVYRHVDAALFGGYLPFTGHRRMVSHKEMHYESIAISGHKFFGIDSPSGLFLCTRDVYDNQADFNVTYLNGNMRMINCSRDAVQPLKFWWIIRKVGAEKWTRQAAQIMECTAYLKRQLDLAGWPAWVNEYSNTVFFRRPSPEIVKLYTLAQGYDDKFGGELAHIVVMQHVTKEKIDRFVGDLKELSDQ
ncbi:MAG: aminotransferase class V-fold PLP-dependent enzyme [Bacteroidales bacterium]|nr:aminotransferase class V-fold PLP-dependent enzyme [Bacteroidales bacterium]